MVTNNNMKSLNRTDVSHILADVSVQQEWRLSTLNKVIEYSPLYKYRILNVCKFSSHKHSRNFDSMKFSCYKFTNSDL